MIEKVKLIPTVKIIGHMTAPETGKLLVSESGAETELTAQGWEKQK
jgi:hypothetical protein